ncbi:MAG TPA: WYL domain-containing protein [Armatimonadota bacterium]|jgi:predicted DNA-binding transcriptional regulator YafY
MPFARSELVRLLKIHREITLGLYPSLERLAALCEIHPRTVKRDLRLLRKEFDAPLEYSRQHDGYTYAHAFSLAPAPFAEQELLALSITMEIADTFRNASFVPALKHALQQMQLMYPESMLAACGDIPASISCVADPAPPETVDTLIHFNELLNAIKEHRQVRMVYYTISRDREEARTVDPYLLYLYRGMWYLYGWCHLRREPRDFAIWRIKELATLPETFPAPDLQAIRTTLASRFTNIQETLTEVVVRFDAEEARWIRERVWHPSQRLEEHADGSCTLAMTVSGLTSVVRWVLGFGRHATPLAPPELVARVAEEVEAMRDQLSGTRDR